MRLESRLKHKVQSCQPRKQNSVKQYSQIFTHSLHPPPPPPILRPKEECESNQVVQIFFLSPVIPTLEGPYKVSVLTGCRLSCHVARQKKTYL